MPAPVTPTHIRKGTSGGIFPPPTIQQAIGDMLDGGRYPDSFPCNEEVSDFSLKRAQWNELAPTIVGDPKKGHLHPLRNRRFTVGETMRLMGLSDNFEMYPPTAQQLKELGNGIAVPVAFAFAVEAWKALCKNNQVGNGPPDVGNSCF
ncbi:hypothetical protein BDZ88DRAFT_127883 [Geranomyces variabilis]|nr:hypothetical protein BDZ88DRAFT_127883 [Geranomyces variabilis]